MTDNLEIFLSQKFPTIWYTSTGLEHMLLILSILSQNSQAKHSGSYINSKIVKSRIDNKMILFAL